MQNLLLHQIAALLYWGARVGAGRAFGENDFFPATTTAISALAPTSPNSLNGSWTPLEALSSLVVAVVTDMNDREGAKGGIMAEHGAKDDNATYFNGTRGNGVFETLLNATNTSVEKSVLQTATETPYVPYVMRPETYIVPVLFAFIFIVGVVGNGTLIVVFLTVRQMRNVPNT